MKFFLLVLFFSNFALGNTSGISYQGRIIKPDGNPLEGASVQFRLQIRSPGPENCLMYEEIQSLNMSSSQGLFSLTINDGTGTRLDAPNYQLDRIFANRETMTFDSSRCTTGITYTPNTADGRKFVVYFKDETMGEYEPMPVMNLNYVPMALNSIESQKVGLFSPANLVRTVDGSGNPATAPALTPAQLAEFLSVINGTSSKYMGVQSTGGASFPSYTTASPPASPAEGSFWYDSTSKQLKFYDGTSTQAVSNAASIAASAITSGVIAPARLGTGTADSTTFLRGDGTWNTVSSSQWITNGSDIGYTAGRVGLGTSAPQSNLEIYTGDALVNSANLLKVKHGSCSNGTGSGIGFSVECTGSTGTTIGAKIVHVRTSGNSIGDLAFFTNSAGLTPGDFSTEKMRITSTGNVGIGTASPFGSLHVLSGHSTSTPKTYTGYGTNFGAVINGYQLDAGGSYERFVDIAAMGHEAASVGSNIRLLTQAGGGSSLEERLRVTAAGNVGIGTTTPAEKLEVNGALKLGTTVTANAGTIRWNGTHFQGYNGSAWANFVPNPPATGSCDTTEIYSVPGNYIYTVPASFGTITIRLWGGGGAGGNRDDTPGGNGGNSTILSLGLLAGGGATGTDTGGAGGTGSGGDINTTGGIGTDDGVTNGSGGNAPNGGTGGLAAAATGNSPGGGGAGGYYVVSTNGAGGGSGSYVEKVFTTATLTPGATLNDIVVAAGGIGVGSGAGRGGTGGSGQVTISCATAGLLPANNRGIVFWNAGSYDSSTTFVHDTSGNVGIGTPSPDAKLDVVDTGTTKSAIIVPRAGNFTGTSVNGMIRYNTASTLFEFYQNGVWVNYTTVSDGRLKTNVVPVVDGLDIVNRLNPVFYDWDRSNPKATSFEEKHQVGFIAQEVEKILPEVVNVGEDNYRSIEYGKIVSVVVAAVKELYNKVLGTEAHNVNQDRAIASIREDNVSKDKEIAKLKAKVQKAEQENAMIKAYLCAKDSRAPICK